MSSNVRITARVLYPSLVNRIADTSVGTNNSIVPGIFWAGNTSRSQTARHQDAGATSLSIGLVGIRRTGNF